MDINDIFTWKIVSTFLSSLLFISNLLASFEAQLFKSKIIQAPAGNLFIYLFIYIFIYLFVYYILITKVVQFIKTHAGKLYIYIFLFIFKLSSTYSSNLETSRYQKVRIVHL